MAEPKKPTATPPAEDKAKKVSDPELKAMHTIGRLLGEMDHDARFRVLNYVNAKYGPSAIKPMTEAAPQNNGAA